jgi:hypothetical protein
MVRLILHDIYGLTVNAISRVVVHKRDITCSALPNVEQRVRLWRAGDTCDWPSSGLRRALLSTSQWEMETLEGRNRDLPPRLPRKSVLSGKAQDRTY